MNANFNANDKYWAFTVTPDAGKTIDFTEISFYYNRADGNSADEWRLRSSANSYATDLVGLTAMTGTDNTTPLTFTFTNKSISLTGITAATTFRLYTYSAAGSGSALRIDDITLSGTVVPEPVSAGVLAAGRRGGAARSRVRPYLEATCRKQRKWAEWSGKWAMRDSKNREFPRKNRACPTRRTRMRTTFSRPLPNPYTHAWRRRGTGGGRTIPTQRDAAATDAGGGPADLRRRV